MREDLVIQFKRQMPIAVSVLAILVACDISTTAGAERWSTIALVASMVRILAWCFFIVIAALRIFQYFNGGDDYFLLLSAFPRHRGVLPLALAYGISIWVDSVVDSLFRLTDIPTTGQKALTAQQFGFLFLSRTVSIAAFILLCLCISAAVARIRRTNAGAFVAVLIFVLITIAQGAAIFGLMKRGCTDFTWGVGANSAFTGISQYANILPIMMWGTSHSDAATTMYWPTVFLNAGTAIILWALWRTVVPRIRIDYIR